MMGRFSQTNAFEKLHLQTRGHNLVEESMVRSESVSQIDTDVQNSKILTSAMETQLKYSQRRSAVPLKKL